VRLVSVEREVLRVQLASPVPREMLESLEKMAVLVPLDLQVSPVYQVALATLVHLERQEHLVQLATLEKEVRGVTVVMLVRMETLELL
jgi:hypothetical protein